LNKNIILFILIVIILSGCMIDDVKQSLGYLGFLESSEQITIHAYDTPQPVNPYLITENAEEIKELISMITSKQGELVDDPNSSLFSENIYLISFNHAIKENGETLNLSVVYDLDKNLLLLPSKYHFKPNKNKKKPQKLIVHTSKKFKIVAKDALQRAETTLTKEALREREELLESVSPGGQA